MDNTFEIRDLRVSVEGKEILKGVSLTIRKGEIHALMGPNGSGKSTLSMALMGHPLYSVTNGTALYKGLDVLGLPPDERARQGLFLAFQYPQTIPGLTVSSFLRMAVSARRGLLVRANGDARPDGPRRPGQDLLPVKEFLRELKEKMAALKLDSSFMSRHLNDGFSGGEKKRVEILQMALLNPEFAILDETDSGLDIDALKVVAEGVNRLTGPNMGVLLITHYQRLLDYIKPHVVHVLMDGRIVRTGGPELARELEAQGYEGFRPSADGGEATHATPA
ncbi:MAG: Fe-S cluster assembly ATPase SufC [Nitrospirae bacterium]|nr:Fe-S cluster assembly ATPase SufC [Nitrospirota bacterium]